MGGVPIGSNWENYVNTDQFDKDCKDRLTRARKCASDENNDSGYEDPFDGDWSVEASPHDVPRIEAHLYYAGIGPKGRGPKLIYRNSKHCKHQSIFPRK